MITDGYDLGLVHWSNQTLGSPKRLVAVAACRRAQAFLDAGNDPHRVDRYEPIDDEQEINCPTCQREYRRAMARDRQAHPLAALMDAFAQV